MNIKNIIITLVAIIVLVVAERGIAGFVLDYYGPHDAATDSPFLCINGDQDNSVDIKSCKQVEQVLIANDRSVEADVLKGSGHAWETNIEQKEYPSPYAKGEDIKAKTHVELFVNQTLNL